MVRAGSPPVEIAVHDLGGSGPQLLISHATGFHGRSYEPLAAALADHFRSIAFDYRGHGDTPVPPGWAVAWEGYGDDAVAVAESLDHPLAAFGHSMGGTAVLMAAHRHPSWFTRLVLFEPIVLPPHPPAPDGGPAGIVEGARRRRATFPSFDDAYRNYAAKPPLNAFTPAALHAYVDHGFRLVPGGVELKCTPEHEAATFEMGGRHATWELLPEIEVPVTVVGGVLDGTPPAAFAGEISDRLPNGSLVYVDDFDHFAPMADPEAVAKIIIAAAG
jgi:pimeloyl-ACP methyl ester carboxylesterase